MAAAVIKCENCKTHWAGSAMQADIPDNSGNVGTFTSYRFQNGDVHYAGFIGPPCFATTFAAPCPNCGPEHRLTVVLGEDVKREIEAL